MIGTITNIAYEGRTVYYTKIDPITCRADKAPTLPSLFMAFIILYWSFIPVININPQKFYIPQDESLISAASIMAGGLSTAFSSPIVFKDTRAAKEVVVNSRDKKNNPIAGDSVAYVRMGDPIAWDHTDEQGVCTLYIDATDVPEPEIEQAERMKLASSNPYNYEVKFEINTEKPGVMTVYNIAGQLIDRLDFEKAGQYEVAWGGMNTVPGVYLVSFHNPDWAKTMKISQIQSGGKGLEVESFNSINNYFHTSTKSALELIDTITFRKANTTPLDLQFNLGNDTTIYVNRNIGLRGDLEDKVAEVGETIEWILTQELYNDDETPSYFTTSTLNAWIEQDTILKFEVTDTGTFTIDVEWTDPDDASLEGVVDAEVYVGVAPPPTFSLPNQTRPEDTPTPETIIPDMSQSPYYFHPTGVPAQSFEVVYESNPTLMDVDAEGFSLVLNYLQANGSGNSIIKVVAMDQNGLSDTAQFTFTITQVNDYPQVVDDNAVIPYATATLVNPLLNDSDTLDPQGGIDPATLSIITQPMHSAATVTNGQIELIGDVGYSGQDSLKYQVYDNGIPAPALSGTAWLVYTIQTGNFAPTLTLPDTIYENEDVGTPKNLLNLMQYYSDPEGQTGIFSILNQSNATLANTQIQQDSMLVLTYLQANGYGTSEIEIEASDGNGGVSIDEVVLKVLAVNDKPIARDDSGSGDAEQEISVNILSNDDDDNDPQGGIDVGSATIISGPSHGSANISNGVMYYTSVAGFSGTDQVAYEVSDLGYPLPAKKDTAIVVFNISYTPQPPNFNLPDTSFPEDNATPQLVFEDMGSTTYYSSPQGTPAASFTVISNTNPSLLTMNVQDDDLYMNYLQANGNGTSTVGVEVTDLNGQKDTAYFLTTINPRADVYFQVKWLMTDALATNSTLIIGSDQYNLPNGDTTLQIDPSTQEVNATNPNSWDGKEWWNAPHYTAIQRSGQLANVEQRARSDFTSPVVFGTIDDTLVIYKLKYSEVDLLNVRDAICTGPTGETIRFAWDDWDATAYFDESGTNQTPNATTVSRVQDLLFNHMPDATLGKLQMVYGQGTNPPTGENYLEMAINTAFPGAGNGTAWDSNFEITFAYAHWSTNASTGALWEEIIQGVQHQSDVGISVTYYNGSTWEISTFGKQCLRLGYNFDPGTRF